MKGYSQFRPMLILVLICLFLISIILPGTMGQPTLMEKTFGNKARSDLFHISGTMGQNGWYISNVQITIHPPDGAWHVYYSFDNDTWTEYTTPIILDSDGIYTVYCYYMIEGNQSEIFSVSFKIDTTPPFVNISFHREGCRILVSVDAFDNTSGVVGVEFYLDGALVGNVTAEPYEFEFSIGLFGKHTVGVIVYDAAGNSAEASHTFPYDFSCVPSYPASIFHLQFAMAVTWSGNETSTPIAPGETRKVDLTISYVVTHGLFGKMLLKFLEGTLFPIDLFIENTSDWCDAWIDPENVTGVVHSDEVGYENASLFIHVHDDAPGNFTTGWVKSRFSAETMKGPFNLFTLIHGYELSFTITYITGP